MLKRKKGNDSIKFKFPVDVIWIVSPPKFIHNRVFDDLALALQCGFEELGYPVPVLRKRKPPASRPLVLGCNLIPPYNITGIPKDAILFNLEQLDESSSWLTPAYWKLIHRHSVWEYSHRNLIRFGQLGVTHPVFCGIGYADRLTRIHPHQEDIDVLFYGSPNARRDRVLDDLRRVGLKVVNLFGVYGQRRDNYIARSKIVLNVHYYESRIFEITRIGFLLANRRFVISENGTDGDLETPYRTGLVFCDYEELIDCCRYYVSRETARRRIAATGYEAFRSRRQSHYLKACLDRFMSQGRSSDLSV
jgi:hypothetical protein